MAVIRAFIDEEFVVKEYPRIFIVVHLSRITTKTGDAGTTALGDGSRVPKHDCRIAAYGTIDETSSVLGVVLTYDLPVELSTILRAVQNDLFDVGADLCVPGQGGGRLRLQPAYTERLEGWIAAHNAGLPALDSFVLPGGKPAAAWLHVARTVCRRAERLTSELLADPKERERTNPEVLRYLNRLSDLLFILARVANDGGKLDVVWRPGETQGGPR